MPVGKGIAALFRSVNLIRESFSEIYRIFGSAQISQCLGQSLAVKSFGRRFSRTVVSSSDCLQSRYFFEQSLRYKKARPYPE